MIDSLTEKLDTSPLTKNLETLISTYKQLEKNLKSLKDEKNIEIISLVKTLTAKLSGENKLFEKKQMQLLNSLQSKYDVQNRQIEIFRKHNNDIKDEHMKIFLSKKTELFNEMSELTEAVTKLEEKVSNQQFEKATFLEDAIEKKNRIVGFQEEFKEEFINLSNPVRETVLGSKELVKVLQKKISDLKTEQIIETLEDIKDIL